MNINSEKVNPELKSRYFDESNINSLIQEHEGILNVIRKDNYGKIIYEFVIDKNHSSLINFLELYDYKNVVYSII